MLGVAITGAAIAVAMGIVLASSSDMIYGSKITAKDAMEGSKARLSELLQVTGSASGPPASAELVNYGSRPVQISQVLIDAQDASYLLYSYESSNGSHYFGKTDQNGTIPAGILVRLEAAGSGGTMQVITAGSNVIEIPLT